MQQCIDRILDLGGEVKLETKPETQTFRDPIEWVKFDLQVSKDGLQWLAGIVEEARTD